MVFINGLLTFVLVLNCLILVFLVLIQLPKKDAGAGLAFGGAATDALFGAGSGNILTKVTKYCAGLFFGLVVLLAILQTHFLGQGRGSDFEKRLREAGQVPAAATAPATAPGSTTTPAQATNSGLLSAPAEAPATPSASNATPAPAPQQ
jgi:preprotein translocase subunit SecG